MNKDPGGNFEKWNEEMAKKYDMECCYKDANFIIRAIEKKRMETAVKLLSAAGTDRVLDIGCGAGHMLEMIKEGELSGMDISDTMLEKAGRRLGNKNVKLVKGDAEKLPFADKQFNKILCSEVIEHVVSPELVIKEMLRVAADGAVFIITIPNEMLINKLKGFFIKLKLYKILFQGKYKTPARMDDEWHLHSLNLEVFKKIIDGSMLIKSVKCVPYGFLPIRYVVKLVKK